jgi:Uma2 family endonuclease
MTLASLIPCKAPPLPLPEEELPILFQEEEDDGMGEGNLHAVWGQIVFVCLKAHLANRRKLRVYTNLNLYYRKRPLHPKTKSRPNVAADAMVVQPFKPLPEDVQSYTIGEDGPAPLLAAEVLSKRTARKRDLNQKQFLYAGLGVAEYVLADPTGRFVPDGLLLKRLQPDRTWRDERDADGGVTSQLGFRMIIDDDQLPRLIDVATGKRYTRPEEGQFEADRRRELEDRVRALEAEMRARNGADETKQTKKSPRRRKP